MREYCPRRRSRAPRQRPSADAANRLSVSEIAHGRAANTTRRVCVLYAQATRTLFSGQPSLSKRAQGACGLSARLYTSQGRRRALIRWRTSRLTAVQHNTLTSQTCARTFSGRDTYHLCAFSLPRSCSLPPACVHVSCSRSCLQCSQRHVGPAAAKKQTRASGAHRQARIKQLALQMLSRR